MGQRDLLIHRMPLHEKETDYYEEVNTEYSVLLPNFVCGEIVYIYSYPIHNNLSIYSS